MSSNRLEKVTNMAAAIMFLSVTVLVLSRLFASGAAGGGKPNPAYAPGEQIEHLTLQQPSADHTLLFVVRSGCQFCTDSMDFYHRLVQARDQRKARIRLVAMTPDAPYLGEMYLRRHDVQVDEVDRLPLQIARRISGTPTLIALDGAKKILRVWEGKLTADQERQVEGFLKRLPCSAR